MNQLAIQEVQANSVADFLARYYKAERYTLRGEAYAAVMLASHEADFENDGYDDISRFDSVTGCAVRMRAA